MMRKMLLLALGMIALGCSAAAPAPLSPEAVNAQAACNRGDQSACLEYQNLVNGRAEANKRTYYYIQNGATPYGP
jgi:hypothetical protein